MYLNIVVYISMFIIGINVCNILFLYGFTLSFIRCFNKRSNIKLYGTQLTNVIITIDYRIIVIIWSVYFFFYIKILKFVNGKRHSDD